MIVYVPADIPVTEKEPSLLEADPRSVPSTETFAPIKELPSESLTVPETV